MNVQSVRLVFPEKIEEFTPLCSLKLGNAEVTFFFYSLPLYKN